MKINEITNVRKQNPETYQDMDLYSFLTYIDHINQFAKNTGYQKELLKTHKHEVINEFLDGALIAPFDEYTMRNLMKYKIYMDLAGKIDPDYLVDNVIANHSQDLARKISMKLQQGFKGHHLLSLLNYFQIFKILSPTADLSFLVKPFNAFKESFIVALLKILKNDVNSANMLRWAVLPNSKVANTYLKWPELDTINNSIELL